jgi:ubiquinone/menaquinone biosynthesis C-methylase UbiE
MLSPVKKSDLNFDRVARHYRLLETIAFGRTLQRARVFGLNQIESPMRALIAGEGNGRFLCELLRRHPKIGIDCVDASGQMLRLAETRLTREQPNVKQVRFLQEDIKSWRPPANRYDLLVTHFFLDCFTKGEIDGIVETLAQSATADAVWLLADFSVPRDLVRKIHADVWLWLMHRFFGALAGISARHLTDPSPFLEAHGFVRAERRTWRLGLVKSELWRRSMPAV